MRHANFAVVSAAALALAAGAASADLINPSNLLNSPDGGNADVQQAIFDAGYTSNVGVPEVNFGDQTDDQWFTMCPNAESMDWAIEWQFAGNGPNHKLGYFSVAEPGPGDITWVIGGSNSGLPAAASVAINGVFALAFYSGDNGGNNSTVYYSVTSLNPDGKDHLASLKLRDAQGDLEDCGRILSWEDLPNLGDADYNDFGVIAMNGIIPAPATMPLAGLALLAAARRRR
jgi:uncharacterized protein (TIGR03382 family)